MLKLRLASLCLLVAGTLPLLYLFLELLPANQAQLLRHSLHGLIAAVLALALWRGSARLRLAAIIYSGLIATGALLGLFASQMLDLWLISGTPRQIVLAQTLIAATSVAACTLLLLSSDKPAMPAQAQAGRSELLEWSSLLVALAMVGGLAWLALARYPQLVVDPTHYLNPDEQQGISRFHGLLRHDYGIDYRVVIEPGVDDINALTAQRFAELDIGLASDTGRGLLLLLDPQNNLVRLEVGYSLESVFVDAFVAYIEHHQMLPFFAADRVADGILATTELIVQRADNARSNAGFADELWMQGSGGGGATAQTHIDEGARTKADRALGGNPAGKSPREILRLYQKAMAERNDNPRLPIYSKASQRMMADWVVTPAQMDNLARSLAVCPVERELYGRDGNHAVLRAPIGQRKCSPYFFVRENGEWRLDLPAMMQAIRFGRGNQWHLSGKHIGDYAFGFADLSFDRNGYPRE